MERGHSHSTGRRVEHDSGTTITRRGPGGVRRVGDLVVLEPEGVLDAACLDWLRRQIDRSRPAPVAIVLDGCALINSGVGRALMEVLVAAAPGPVGLVCRRGSCRTLLSHPSNGWRSPVFSRLAEALAAYEAHGDFVPEGPPEPAERSAPTGGGPDSEQQPHVAGVAATVRSRGCDGSATSDFWDLFPLAGGGHGLVVGDVTGCGSAAAGAATDARRLVHAAASLDPRPDLVLRELNDRLMVGEERILATAVAARFRHYRSTVRVQIARAGHPYPVLLHRHRAATAVHSAGRLLGAFADPELELVTIVLRPGDALVVMTDGTGGEREVGRGGRSQFEAVVRTLLAHAGSEADVLADAVFDHAAADDDATVVVLSHSDRH